jgi:hypothetical protein
MKDMKRDPQLKGHTPGVFDIGKAATSDWTGGSAIHRPDTHRRSDDFITLLLEKPGGGT